jgi:hypothetical protein
MVMTQERPEKIFAKKQKAPETKTPQIYAALPYSI